MWLRKLISWAVLTFVWAVLAGLVVGTCFWVVNQLFWGTWTYWGTVRFWFWVLLVIDILYDGFNEGN